jgi:hypothetical protein
MPLIFSHAPKDIAAKKSHGLSATEVALSKSRYQNTEAARIDNRLLMIETTRGLILEGDRSIHSPTVGESNNAVTCKKRPLHDVSFTTRFVLLFAYRIELARRVSGNADAVNNI